MVVVVAAVLLLIIILLLPLVLVDAVALVAVLVISPVTTPATGIHTRHNLKNLKYISRLHTTLSWISAIWSWHFCLNRRCDENWNVPISWIVWNGGGTEPLLSTALQFQSLQRKASSTAWTVEPCKLIPIGTWMLDRLYLPRVLCWQRFRCRQILRPRKSYRMYKKIHSFHGGTAPSVLGPPRYQGSRSHLIKTHKLGRSPLDGWSVRSRDLYLHNTQY